VVVISKHIIIFKKNIPTAQKCRHRHFLGCLIFFVLLVVVICDAAAIHEQIQNAPFRLAFGARVGAGCSENPSDSRFGRGRGSAYGGGGSGRALSKNKKKN
jgi:hypothetical protein